MPLDDSYFADAKAVKREVVLGDGKKHPFWFREASAGDFRRYQIGETSPDPEARIAAMFHLVAACVCEPDGTPALTVDRAMALKTPVLNALVVEIMALNDLSKKAKNASPPKAKNGSGT